MKTLFIILAAIVALEHLYFLILEMFFWTKPKGMKAFGLSKEQAESSKVLAANQGLYNGFLASGLIWGLLSNKTDVIVFFLVCVSISRDLRCLFNKEDKTVLHSGCSGNFSFASDAVKGDIVYHDEDFIDENNFSYLDAVLK